MNQKKKSKIELTAEILMKNNDKFTKNYAMEMARNIHLSEWNNLSTLEDKKTDTELVKRNKGNLTFDLVKRIKPSPTEKEAKTNLLKFGDVYSPPER